MCKINKSKFLVGWIKGIILGNRLLSFQKLGSIDKLLLELVGLPHVPDLAVHPVNFFGWVSQRDHFEPLYSITTFLPEYTFMLKS